MTKFKLRDRVIVTGDSINENIDNSIGTIIDIFIESSITSDEIDNGIYSVEFDHDISGHSLCGKCKPGHGWLCVDKDMILYTTKLDLVYDESKELEDII